MRNPFCLFLIIGVFFMTNISAQPEMDTTFNSNGKLVISGFLASTQDIAIQPDNKIVFVNSCYTINGPFPVCVGRLNEDGSRDMTFGTSFMTGFALTTIQGSNTNYERSTQSVEIQKDGKIVAAGYSSFQGSQDFRLILVRYNTNGTLDTTFGTNGVVVNVFTAATRGTKVLIQSDGKIFVAGYVGTDPNYELIGIRFNSDGTLDQTFANGGYFQVNIPGNRTSGISAALQADGKILIGGTTWTLPGAPAPYAASLLVRLNTDGTLDQTFDGDGIRTIVFGTTSSYYGGFRTLAVQSDGRILALDSTKKIYRFNLDGSLDAGFNNGGWREVLTANTTVNDFTVTPSGKITVIGERTYCNCSGPYLYHVARYNPDGSTDLTFSDDGYLEIDISSSTNDGARTVTYDKNGRVVIGGFAATGTVLSPYENGTWSLARLIASPAQNVGFSGRVLKPDGKPVLNAFITLKFGSEIIASGRTNPFGYFHFKNIQSGQTYSLSVNSKGLNYDEQSVTIDGEIVNYLIVGTKQ